MDIHLQINLIDVFLGHKMCTYISYDTKRLNALAETPHEFWTNQASEETEMGICYSQKKVAQLKIVARRRTLHRSAHLVIAEAKAAIQPLQATSIEVFDNSLPEHSVTT